MGNLLKVFFFTLIISLNASNLFSAQQALTPIHGSPSNEIFDMLLDSKGFLWIADNPGVSKYDGISFTKFSNPAQSSLSMTGLLEDKHGRIWMNNFTGQIFYIEHGQMKLLKAYESLKENSFPRIGLFNNLLVATTDHGFFTCNTDNMECHYLQCPAGVKNGTASLAVLKDKVIAFGNGNWFIYTPKQGLTLATFDPKEASIISKNGSTLAARSYHDTIFLFTNPNNLLYKLTCVGNEIKVRQVQHFGSFINTVTVNPNGYFVNTIGETIDNQNKSITKRLNLSSVVFDKAGRKWFGSLDYGLMVDAGISQAITQPAIIKSTTDRVLCLTKDGDNLFAGTSEGHLLQYNLKSHQTSLLANSPQKNSGISYLYVARNHDIFIAGSVNTYRYDALKHALNIIDTIKTLKQVDTENGQYLLATSHGLFLYSQAPSANIKKTALNSDRDLTNVYRISEKRCRSVCYVPGQHTIWASFKDGLFQIMPDKSLVPLLYNSEHVYASCLAAVDKQLVVGTFNNGIIIKNGDQIKRISIENGLYSNSITGVKIRGKHLWVLTSGTTQLFDLDTYQLINEYDLPGRNDVFVKDIEEDRQSCYMVTPEGLFAIPQSFKSNEFEPTISLTGLIINGRDTATVGAMELHHDQNDIQLKLGIPLLPRSSEIYVKYRLLDGKQSNWAYGNPGERNFHFASLMPGKYLFEAVAGYPQSGIGTLVYRFNFVIRPAWWQTIWFLILVFIALAGIVFSFIRIYYHNQLSAQKHNYEKELLIRSERQRISGEMHDDIGSGLAAIKLLSGEIKAGRASLSVNDGLRTLSDMVNTLSDKMREVIWSLNVENDDLESVLFFIQSHARQLFAHSSIKFSTLLPDQDIPELMIDGSSRRNIYLITKELLHNIIKHSGATYATLIFELDHTHLFIIMSDDGVGFDIHANASKSTGMGLKNILQRVKQLNGTIITEQKVGTKLTIIIPLIRK